MTDEEIWEMWRESFDVHSMEVDMAFARKIEQAAIKAERERFAADRPDTLAMLKATMGGDVLCNHTTGRYLSDHIEELIEGRVQAAIKAEREAAAKLVEARAESCTQRSMRDALKSAAAAIRRPPSTLKA